MLKNGPADGYSSFLLFLIVIDSKLKVICNVTAKLTFTCSKAMWNNVKHQNNVWNLFIVSDKFYVAMFFTVKNWNLRKRCKYVQS